VLQEALTNIQRHSRSTKADVHVTADRQTAALKIWDYGAGMPPEIFQSFQENGASIGVGLAGMKERVGERHGKIEIRSDSAGTSIFCHLPRSPRIVTRLVNIAHAGLPALIDPSPMPAYTGFPRRERCFSGVPRVIPRVAPSGRRLEFPNCT
jgi:hypothetical protein